MSSTLQYKDNEHRNRIVILSGALRREGPMHAPSAAMPPAKSRNPEACKLQDDG
jgi:hypothetical protein